MKKTALICLLTAFIMVFSACSSTQNTVSNVQQPENISTGDQIYPAQNLNASEESDNVNGMRFTMTLNEFTQKYNEIMQKTGGKDYLNKSKWAKTGDTQKDSNGVNYDCYYYDSEKINFTATVETNSGKLMNVGCGTTMALFVSQENNQIFSDVVLRKSAIMAIAVCGFPASSLDVIQDIFYRTTFENTDSLWYQGNIFSLSMKEDKADSQKSTMLFRVFPVTDDLRKEWNIEDYETYIQSASTQSIFGNNSN